MGCVSSKSKPKEEEDEEDLLKYFTDMHYESNEILILRDPCGELTKV